MALTLAHVAPPAISTPTARRGMLRPMDRGTRSFVGRAREVDAITHAIDAAVAGRGSLWFVVGEPGIGKSRFAEEVARIAAERHVNVLFGRCWEAGGAPSYWPFVQAARRLLRMRGELADRLRIGAGAAELAELVPELGELAAARVPALEPEQARFRRLDAFTTFFCDAAARAPMLLILEDLHAADPSSVLLLAFLARQLPVARLVVLGTYREVDAERSPIGRPLARLAAEANVLALRRLGRAEVTAYLEHVQGAPARETLVDAVYAATEGNPLFVGEVARRGGRASRPDASPHAIPTGVKAAIRERLDALAPSTRPVLEVAAVVGREFRPSFVARVVAADEACGDGSDVARAFDDAIEAELAVEVAPGQLRFAHILFQQVLYADLDPARRSALHRAVADELGREKLDPLWTERAHHLLAAGDLVAREAAASALVAARRAAEQHALAEAAAWHARAFEALTRAGASAEERCERLLELGEAQILAHDLEAGRRSCADAAALARELGDPDRFARAALAHGAVFVLAEVSPVLVGMLREALAMLGPGDGALRALVMARLAAALQPAVDPGPPIALALEAIAMARRIGDRATLLATLRSGGSALMDLADPETRMPLNREHVAIAEELGNLPERFRGHLRLVSDLYALGDVAGAHASMEACRSVARAIDQPHYLWRVEALDATRAMFEGRFEDAQASQERARALGERASDPNAERVYLFQRLMLLRLVGRFEALPAVIDALFALLPSVPFARDSAAVWAAAELARAGRLDEARVVASGARASLDALANDLASFDHVAEAIAVLGDPEAARALYEARLDCAEQLVSGGVIGLTWEMPVHRGLGRLAATLGRPDLADAHLGAAVARLERLGARPLFVLAALDHVEVLAQRGDRGRASAIAERAEAEARAIGASPWAARASAVRARIAAEAAPEAAAPSAPARLPLPEVGSVRLEREGSVWTVACEGRIVRLKHSKGLAMLARLVEAEGREFHALDLAADGGAIDAGDAGEILDARARDAYRARVAELRDEVEEAESLGDLGRAEHAREELDRIAEQLARAVGLGGRSRVAASATERARVNVQRRLRDAVARIAEQDPALGRHLEWAVRTGTFCSYRPR